MKSAKLTEQFVIGLAGAPFGLDGSVKVKLFSDETYHLKGLKSVILRQNGTEKTFPIEKINFTGKNSNIIHVKFSGYDSPEAVKALSGAELVVDRAFASPLKTGEFYIEDLKGLNVKTEIGDLLGNITGIIEGGNGSITEIKLVSGEIKLVPFINEFFGEINLELGYILILKQWILE